jgi:hypothetical protein
MNLRRVRLREQRHHRKRLAGIDGAQHGADLMSVGEFGGAVDGLGGFTLGVADDQFDLPPVDTAGRVDLLNGELNAAIDPDPGGGRRTGERRKIAVEIGSLAAMAGLASELARAAPAVASA